MKIGFRQEKRIVILKIVVVVALIDQEKDCLQLLLLICRNKMIKKSIFTGTWNAQFIGEDIESSQYVISTVTKGPKNFQKIFCQKIFWHLFYTYLMTFNQFWPITVWEAELTRSTYALTDSYQLRLPFYLHFDWPAQTKSFVKAMSWRIAKVDQKYRQGDEAHPFLWKKDVPGKEGYPLTRTIF